jgi:hypothetical protein
METVHRRANIPYYQTAREICWPKNFVLHPSPLQFDGVGDSGILKW